jgi:hypothetical protein
MAKRFSVFLVVMAVLGAAIPATASASKGLEEGKVLLAAGAQFNLTNVGVVTTTSTKIGNVTCNNGSITIKTEVTENTAAAGFKGKGVGEGVINPQCERAGGVETKMTRLRLAAIQSTAAENGDGKASLSYELDVGALTCTFSATAAEFTYTAGSDLLKFNEQTFTVTPAGCGTTAKLDGEFTLSTTVAPFTPVLFD